MEQVVKICCLLLVISVLQSYGQPSRIKRQSFGWEDVINANTDVNAVRPETTTRTTTTTTTTPSPAYTQCIRRCPTTPQYNPICGTNRVTYPNESHLRCANQCGLSVQRAFGGTCQPL